MQKIKEVKYVPLKLVEADPEQPRRYFAAEKLASLASSIKRIGIKEPITVEDMKDGTYKIIDGERRFRAALIAGITEVPVLIDPPMSAQDRLVMQFHLQEQHAGWTPHEKAVAIRDAANMFKVPYKEMAKILGVGTRQIEQYLAFVEMASHTDYAKSELPIIWTTYFKKVVHAAKKAYETQLEQDFGRADQKKLEMALIERVKTGEITTGIQFVHLADAITSDVKAVAKLTNSRQSLLQIYKTSDAGAVRLVRELRNVVTQANMKIKRLQESSEAMKVAKSDAVTQSIVKSTAKALQELNSTIN